MVLKITTLPHIFCVKQLYDIKHSILSFSLYNNRGVHSKKTENDLKHYLYDDMINITAVKLYIYKKLNQNKLYFLLE